MKTSSLIVIERKYKQEEREGQNDPYGGLQLEVSKWTLGF